MVLWKKNYAEQQRQEALMLRIHEVGGTDHMDKLDLRDASEAITLCRLLNRHMDNGSMKCLERYLQSLHTDGGRDGL
jgi:hypothetical protein